MVPPMVSMCYWCTWFFHITRIFPSGFRSHTLLMHHQPDDTLIQPGCAPLEECLRHPTRNRLVTNCYPATISALTDSHLNWYQRPLHQDNLVFLQPYQAKHFLKTVFLQSGPGLRTPSTPLLRIQRSHKACIQCSRIRFSRDHWNNKEYSCDEYDHQLVSVFHLFYTTKLRQNSLFAPFFGL